MSEYIVDVNDSSEMYAVEMGRYEELREVIRCKDCKYWQYNSCFVESEEGDADSIILNRFAFDFCSRAERREE